jgi:hypothetical protein
MHPAVEDAPNGRPQPGSARRVPGGENDNGLANGMTAPHTPTTTIGKKMGGSLVVPRPRPQQRWVHSCCTIAKLERALGNPDCSAIETDIMMGWAPQPDGGGGSHHGGGGGGASSGLMSSLTGNSSYIGDPQLQQPPPRVPVCAHPTWRLRDGAPELPPHVDLTFADFLERCLVEGRHHLKLDFKELDAVEPCLELLAQKWPQLHANGMAIWLNADVLPGPNARRVGSCRVPAYRFLPLCRKLCPHAYLSLGWRVGPIGPEEVYSPHDMQEMQRVLQEHRIPGSAVVFAASLRLSERTIKLHGELLSAVPDSQLLIWTGTGEPPITASTQARIHLELARMGHAERVGFDVQIARSCSELAGASAIDCTFFWSRFCRTSVCCCCAAYGYDMPHGMPYMRSALALGDGTGGKGSYGERQPLVIERAHGGGMTPNPGATPGSSPLSRALMPSHMPSHMQVPQTPNTPSPTPPGGGLRLELARSAASGEDVSLRF